MLDELRCQKGSAYVDGASCRFISPQAWWCFSSVIQKTAIRSRKGWDVRNHRCLQRRGNEVSRDKLLSICGHCLPNSQMMPPTAVMIFLLSVFLGYVCSLIQEQGIHFLVYIGSFCLHYFGGVVHGTFPNWSHSNIWALSFVLYLVFSTFVLLTFWVG